MSKKSSKVDPAIFILNEDETPILQSESSGVADFVGNTDYSDLETSDFSASSSETGNVFSSFVWELIIFNRRRNWTWVRIDQIYVFENIDEHRWDQTTRSKSTKDADGEQKVHGGTNPSFSVQSGAGPGLTILGLTNRTDAPTGLASHQENAPTSHTNDPDSFKFLTFGLF